jgi:hypothetical protein
MRERRCGKGRFYYWLSLGVPITEFEIGSIPGEKVALVFRGFGMALVCNTKVNDVIPE